MHEHELLIQAAIYLAAAVFAVPLARRLGFGSVLGYLAAALAYPRYFPPVTVWSGLSLLAVAIAVGAWAFYVRTKIREGEIGDGPGWLHPLAVEDALDEPHPVEARANHLGAGLLGDLGDVERDRAVGDDPRDEDPLTFEKSSHCFCHALSSGPCPCRRRRG